MWIVLGRVDCVNQHRWDHRDVATFPNVPPLIGFYRIRAAGEYDDLEISDDSKITGNRWVPIVMATGVQNNPTLAQERRKRIGRFRRGMLKTMRGLLGTHTSC